MKAMLLSAGLGKRLRPLTHEMPKPLIPVAGHPVIAYNLYRIRQLGITEVAVNLHYMGEKIREELGDGSRFGLKIVYSEEPALLGTGGGIRRLKRFFGDETFLVINSDILIDLDLSEPVRFHHSRSALATMVLRRNPDPVRYGTIETDDHGRIREFLGKIRTQSPGLHKWMFTGIHILEPRAIDSMPDRPSFCINRDVYAQWIRSGKPCYGFIHKGYWRDLGTFPDYLQANLDVLGGIAPSLPGRQEREQKTLPESTVLTPPFRIGEKTVLGDHVSIGPSVLIGQGCKIGTGASLSRSVLWPGAVIREGEKIHDMIVTRYQRVHVTVRPQPAVYF